MKTPPEQSLRWLNDGRDIDDIVLDKYLKLTKKTFDTYDFMCIFPSFFYQVLITYEGSNMDLIKTWVDKAKIFDHTTWLIPINLNGNHWVLLLIAPEEGGIVLFDSLLPREAKDKKKYIKYTDKYIKKILDWIQSLKFPDNAVISKRTYKELPNYRFGKVSRQPNMVDCGVYVCMFVKSLMTGEKVGEKIFNNKETKKIREKMVTHLRNLKIPEEK